MEILIQEIVERFYNFLWPFTRISALLLAITVVTVLGPGLINAVLAISVVTIPQYARVIRSSVLSVREQDYVSADRALGVRPFRILWNRVLPNSITPLIVQATLDMGNIVLVGATLSFIGLSEAGIAEWGVLVSEGQAGISAGRWWSSTFPGMMVFLWALGFNLFGDGLRDVLDPRTETSR